MKKEEIESSTSKKVWAKEYETRMEGKKKGKELSVFIFDARPGVISLFMWTFVEKVCSPSL